MANINITTDTDYSSLSPSNNDTFIVSQGAKFTIDQSTIDMRALRCVTFGEISVENTSTTTPIIVALGSTGTGPGWRSEAAGVLNVSGDWIVLGTGNGTAGQTFSIPTAQGAGGVGTQNCPDIGWLWVFGTDTLRDGTSVPRLAMQVDASNYANANDHERAGNVFTHDTTANTVTFKRAVPLGQEVRMPNIIFANGSTFTGSMFSLDFNPTGTFSADKCLWTGDIELKMQASKKVTISNLGLRHTDSRAFDMSNQVQPPEVSNTGVFIVGNVANAYNLSNSPSAGTHKNIWIDAPVNGGSFNVIAVTATADPYIELLTYTNFSRGTASGSGVAGRGVVASTSPNVQLYDVYAFGYHQPFHFGGGSSNCIADNINFRPASRDDVSRQLNMGIFRMTACENNTVTNFTMLPLANSYIYSHAMACEAGTAGNTISGVVLRSGPSGSGNDRFTNVVNDSGKNNRYNDITVHGQCRARAVQHNASSIGSKITNLYFVDEQVDNTQNSTVGARTRMDQVYLNNTGSDLANTAVATGIDSLSVMGINNTADGGAVEKTDGVFYMRMSPTDEESDKFTEVVKTGVIVFNNNNILYMQNSGDIIELESFVHPNISAISGSAVVRGSGTNNFDITVKMRRPDGTYTSYVALTQTAMQTAFATLASDSENRVQFKFRIERTATNLTNYIQDVSFDCTLTGDDVPFVISDPIDVTFTNLVAGSQVVVFDSGTTTERFRTNSSGTSANWTEAYTSDVTYDFTIMKTGLFPIRVTGSIANNVATTINVEQILDRAYQVSSGLSYGTTASLTGTDFDVTTPTTVQNLYSFWIEQWISNSALTNKFFPISTFGPNSFSFNDGHEFTSSSLQYLSRDGFRYFDAGNVTARYCAILSQGATAGLQSEYQQEQGGAITDSLNTGNVDQVIQIFGDATHGNFDYTGYLNFKIQANGFRQAEADVVATFGTLEEQFYVISLNTPQIDDFTTGDPSITGVTITDNSNSPVSWDAGDGAKLYSVTITDTNNNTGENILRFLNYNLSLDATFQGKDPFYWPEMVIDNGPAFETLTGKLYRSTSNVIVGVRVIDGSGNAHTDFTRFQSDDGSYGTPPVFASASVTGIVAGSRLQIYNVTTSTEIYNDIVSGTSYNANYFDGSDYTAGDIVRVRLTYQSGTSAKLGFEANASVTSAGWGVLADQKDDTVYNTIALDGSTITKFVADYVNNEIDIITAVNFSAHELYARFSYFITTEDGIRTFFGAFRAIDIANYINDVTILDLYFNNNTSTNLIQTDNARLYKSNGVYPVRNPTTGGGGMDVVWRNQIAVVETGTSGLTATESAQLFATATQTDLNNLNDLSPQEVANAVWDEPLTGATHNLPTSSGRRLRQAGATLAFEGSVNTHVATTTAFTGNFTNTIDDFYADQVCLFLTGNLAGQARIITSYDGTTKQMTFDEPWSLAPANGDEFEIKGDHTHSLSQIQNGLASQASVDALPSAVDIDNQLISSHGSGDWTTTGVQNSINNLNDFDPATDTVARVALVDTTTVNTDMRGTDNANTVEPPSVVAIDNQITASHGTGSYQTYSGSGLDLTEIKENQVVLNEGLKTVSLIQIHEDNLPNT